MSSKGYRWYNDGKTQVNAFSCPEGFVPGMLRSSHEKSGNTFHERYAKGLIKPLSGEKKKEAYAKVRETRNAGYRELQGRYPKKTIEELYLTENLTVPQLTEKIGSTRAVTERLLRDYGIRKPRSLSSALGQKTKESMYGSKEGYDRHVQEKIAETVMIRHGITMAEMRRENGAKESALLRGRSDKDKEATREKTRSTNQRKYGVDFCCQRAEARRIGSNESKPNRDFAKMLDSEGIAYTREFPLENRSYDFRVGNTLIEIDPSCTHSVSWNPYGRHLGKGRSYHMDKSLLAEENGYRCIHVWDWDDPCKIVTLLGKRRRLFARKCTVREIGRNEYSPFIDKYHIQGNARASYGIGLYFGDELVSVMTFGKPRYNPGYEWELIRYCSSCDVIGGAERLFSHFISEKHPKSAISYCDRSKFDGAVYLRLGFSLKSGGRPGRHWYCPETGRHITEMMLCRLGYSMAVNGMSAKDDPDCAGGGSNVGLMRSHGFLEVYDCGQDTYVREF